MTDGRSATLARPTVEPRSASAARRPGAGCSTRPPSCSRRTASATCASSTSPARSARRPRPSTSTSATSKTRCSRSRTRSVTASHRRVPALRPGRRAHHRRGRHGRRRHGGPPAARPLEGDAALALPARELEQLVASGPRAGSRRARRCGRRASRSRPSRPCVLDRLQHGALDVRGRRVAGRWRAGRRRRSCRRSACRPSRRRPCASCGRRSRRSACRPASSRTWRRSWGRRRRRRSPAGSLESGGTVATCAVGARTAAAATSSMPGPAAAQHDDAASDDGDRAGHQPRTRPADSPEPGACGRPAVPVAATLCRKSFHPRAERERCAGALGRGDDRVAALPLLGQRRGEAGIRGGAALDAGALLGVETAVDVRDERRLVVGREVVRLVNHDHQESRRPLSAAVFPTSARPS